MDIDSFWDLIGACRRQAPSQADRLTWLRDALSASKPSRSVQFQARLDEVTHEACTSDLWSAADLICGGWCSDDGFCYFGLWMVGLGRDAFTRAVADPDALAETPEVRRLASRRGELSNDDWPDWEALDYVAEEVYGILTGLGDDCAEAFYEAVAAEQGDVVGGARPLGERWDVRSGDEASRRLPKLSAMFPVRSRA